MSVSPVCVTVDVEDWIQSTLSFDAAISSRCRTNTLRMLDLFDRLAIRSTCFIQGLVAKHDPKLVAEIAARGHEIACHAHTHRPLHEMSAATLREEIATSKRLLEDAAGAPVIGFRAPDFSLGAPCDSVDDVNRGIFAELAAQGFRYDSSVVPARMRRYGVARAPRGPFWLREGLLELPLATVWLGRRVPALGGGYLRMFPFSIQRVALWQAMRADRPAVVYLHPYELDRDELAEISRRQHIPWKLRLSQSLGRGPRLAQRIDQLRRGRTLQTMGDAYRSLEGRRDLPTA
jgi:polysaccharide deacetylase family protein (PEP-CTERM system associated)